MPEAEIFEAWACDEPPASSTYRVLRDKWLEHADGTMVRVIYEIEVQGE